MEPDEFRGLVLDELNAVYRLACCFVRSKDEAEDLVQETYFRALKLRSTFRTSDHRARLWLFTILHDTHRTWVARWQRPPIVDSDAIDNLPDQPAPSRMALDGIDCDDERMKQSLDALPPAYRAVLLMWAVEGFEYHEIAGIIDAPVGTVMSRLHRALRAITEQMGSRSAKPGGPDLTRATCVNEPMMTERGAGAPSRRAGSA